MQDINAFRNANHIPIIGKVSSSKTKSESKVAEIKTENKVADVALRAYYKAEARGYEPGHEIQDWLDAEAEIAAEASEEKGRKLRKL